MKTESQTFALLALCFCGPLLDAAEPIDEAWLAFNNALGKPALIAANADHELALTGYRPIAGFSASDVDANKLRLGFDLFHERRLSADNNIGCNSCHSGMFGGTDGRRVSTGAFGVSGHLNAPTTFNAAMNFRQFWDGRAVTLTEQALGPIESQIEMAHDLATVVELLQNDDNYAAEFAVLYPDGITAHNIGDALAYFQTMNFTRANTPFLRHLAGEEDQLSEQAMRGWQRFDEIGCVSCHNGINLGGNSYQQLGSATSYFVEHRVANVNDNGLINRSLREHDAHVFKVPTLHGVAETAPYFHDGSIDTLEAAIEEMGEHQLGRQLSQQDIDDISAFLQSLGGRGMGMMMGNMGMGRGQGMRQGQDMGRGQGMHEGQGMRQGQGMHEGKGMRQGQGMHQGGMRPGQGMRQQEMPQSQSRTGTMPAGDTNTASANPASPGPRARGAQRRLWYCNCCSAVCPGKIADRNGTCSLRRSSALRLSAI
ncbi:cytochrome-c peroxidase [Pseudohongiella sp.]|uniref:Cytochrome c domain-containing protein n=1 Tax=marine sediment metagenome TaxID=412755 RepID=A0A0F9WK19_9ZZZZ|nr:cytochrome c peroxidase [Pseudohongiella sp.]HDZ09534.1 c-type cytochrome [Pseudohongiella sp.]HEA63492.1 c-type cytochrome [Pseudohongiella sp.]